MLLVVIAFFFFVLLSSPELLAAASLPLCSHASSMAAMPDSAYTSNLVGLARALISNVTATGSHSAAGAAGTAGGPDQVYCAVLCRGDVPGGADCAQRLDAVLDAMTNTSSSRNDSGSLPASKKSLTVFDDWYQAQISFSDADFLSGSGSGDAQECVVAANLNPPPGTVTRSNDQLGELVATLIGRLADDAAGRPERYTTGDGWFNQDSQTVYGLVQCAEDMPPASCRTCLTSSGIIPAMRRMVADDGQIGGAILGTRCSLWYQTNVQFFPGKPRVSMNMPTPSRFWIWVTIGSLSLIVSISCLLVHIWIKTERKRERARYELRLLSMAIQNVIHLWRIEEGSSGFSVYDFSQIKEATDNFSSENKLGQGGFGPVYKGVLSGGLEVAVKRLAACSVQGLLEFKNEIQLIAKLQHKNLVKLLGCCIQGDQEKMLVYEYMQNKSLDIFIFDFEKGSQLNWSKRLQIIDGIAQGILYLHKHSRLCVVHRDLKASNILLDADMNPKISDFGMARIFCSNMAESNTTRIVGTHGYISPEYAFDGVCSIKSDVFSFGVLVLEIISGKRTTGFYKYDDKLYNLIAYAWQLWRDGEWRELVCVRVGSSEREGMERCLQVALLCVQESAEERPAMDQVVTMLSCEDVSLPRPKQPAYFLVRSTEPQVPLSCDNTLSITLAR